MSARIEGGKSSQFQSIVTVMACLCLVASAGLISCTNGVDSQGVVEPSGDSLIVLADKSEYDTPPRLLIDVDPEYPRLARQAGLQGTVWIDVRVSRTGAVDSVVVSGESGTGALDYSASYTAWERVYTPARKRWSPVAVWVRYREVFSLDSLYGN